MTGDPKYADTAALRAELWQDCLYRFLPNRPASDAERHHAALDRLADLKREAARAANRSSGQEIVNDAMVVLQLLVAEVGAPFLELIVGRFLDLAGEANGVPGVEAADRIASLLTDDPARARTLLLELIQQQKYACPPLQRRALDPAVAILPASLLAMCYDALAALDMGETHPFLAAARTRRARPWSFDFARLRALEHVEFLFGQGLQKKAAYFQVGEAMGGVFENTLRSWKSQLRLSTVPDLNARLKVAQAAGKFAREQKNNPDSDSRPGTMIDAHVMYLLRELADEPLAIFGARYQREFGSVKSRE